MSASATQRQTWWRRARCIGYGTTPQLWQQRDVQRPGVQEASACWRAVPGHCPGGGTAVQHISGWATGGPAAAFACSVACATHMWAELRAPPPPPNVAFTQHSRTRNRVPLPITGLPPQAALAAYAWLRSVLEQWGLQAAS
jgi:hypothetical protein